MARHGDFVFFLPLYLLMVLYPGLFDMLKPFRQLDHWSPTNIHGKLIWNSHLETPLFHDHKRYLAPKLVRIIVALSPPDVTYILGPITFNFFRKWSSILNDMNYDIWKERLSTSENKCQADIISLFYTTITRFFCICCNFLLVKFPSFSSNWWMEGREKWIWIFPISYLDDRMKESDTRFSLKATLKESLCSLRIFNLG